jgi:MSHA biogenesis protein MshI
MICYLAQGSKRTFNVWLAKYAEKYTQTVRQWIEPLFTEKLPEPTSERLCIQIAAKELSLVRANITPGSTDILSSEILHCDDIEAVPIVLSAFISRQELPPATPTYWLLSPDMYQLFLIESLPVAADEFRDALRWRVRSLINFPTEEAVIDSFKLPSKKNALDNMVAAVVTQSTRIDKIISAIKQSGARLTTIDIPELAMRNLTAQYEDDEKSTAFIYFYENTVILNITRQKTLYITRRLNLPTNSDNTGREFEQLSLDILRYFDYFQSQWRHAAPSRIFVAANKQDIEYIAKYLSEYLLQPVTPFQIQSIHGNPAALKSAEKSALLALGCIIRGEDSHDAHSRN